jgi:oxygen-dependent protoporphyrinogen oxidase
MSARRVVVIGGGAAGAAAAYRLRQAGCRVTIVEQLPRLGGRIHSLEMAGQHVEMGGSFLTTRYTNTQRLLTELGLAGRLSFHSGSSAIMRDGRLQQLSAANFIFRRQLLSVPAKWQLLRLGWHALAAWRSLDFNDFTKAAVFDRQSVRSAFPSRGGTELVNYFIDCALNGYSYWSPEQTSYAMLLMVVKFMLRNGSFSLEGGMQQLPEALARGCEVRLGTKVDHLKAANSAYELAVTGPNGPDRIAADGIVCATTASAVPMIMELQPDRKVFFESIKYSATAVAVRHYREPVSLPAGAVAFPRPEHLPAAAITRANEAGSSDNGKSTNFVKCYASGDLGPQLEAASDQEIINLLAPEKLLHDPALAKADDTELQRWPEALPLFETGHFRRLRLFASGRIENPHTPVVFAGDYLGGPFIEGAVTSGLQAGERLLTRIR